MKRQVVDVKQNITNLQSKAKFQATDQITFSKKRPRKVILSKILVSKIHMKSHDSCIFKWKDRILNAN